MGKIYGENEKENGAFPLVSVIVPVYNIKKYLPECVRSITAQSYENLEIILVDDGSTDGTESLCDDLAGEDERIHVFHRENGGSSRARNMALHEAHGEYFGFVDSDDTIEPDMYERLMEAALECDAAIVQIGRDEVDEEGNALKDICIPPQSEERISAHDFLRELLMHRGDCSFCTKVVRRDLFEGREFPQDALNEDFHLLVEMLPEAGEVISLPGRGYHVRYRIGSNTRGKNREQFSRVYADCVDNADLVFDMVRNDYPDLEAVAIRFGVFQRLEYMLHVPISQMDRDNERYVMIVKWLRSHWAVGMCNQYLTVKNKIYHTLFAVAPRAVRRIHKKVRRIK